jgi:hypothetical protein
MLAPLERSGRQIRSDAYAWFSLPSIRIAKQLRLTQVKARRHRLWLAGLRTIVLGWKLIPQVVVLVEYWS